MPLQRRTRQFRKSAKDKASGVNLVRQDHLVRLAKINLPSKVKPAEDRKASKIVHHVRIVRKVVAVQKVVIARRAIVKKAGPAGAVLNGAGIAVEIGIVAVGINGASAILMLTLNWKD